MRFFLLLILTAVTSFLYGFDTDTEALQHIKDNEFTLQPQDLLLDIIERYDREAPGYNRHDGLSSFNYNSLLNNSFAYHHLSAYWFNFDSISYGLDFKYLKNDPVSLVNTHASLIYYKHHFDDYFDDFNIMMKIMNPSPLFLLAWCIDSMGQEDYIIDGISGSLLSYVHGSDMEGWSDSYYNNSLSQGVADMQEEFKLYEDPQPEDLAEIYFFDVINYDFLRLRHFSMGLGYSYIAFLEPLIESFVDYDDGFQTEIYGGDINSIFRSFYFDLNVIHITSDILSISAMRNLADRFNTGLLAFVERTVRKYDVTSLGVKLFSLPLIGDAVKFDGKYQLDRYTNDNEEKLLLGRLSIHPDTIYLAAELGMRSPDFDTCLYDYGLFLEWDLSYEIGGVLEASVRMFDSSDLIPRKIDDLEISVSLNFIY